MAASVSVHTARLLRTWAADAPLNLRIAGDCMAPLLASGARVRVVFKRTYWPGDLVVVLAPDGRLLAHRLLGWYLKKGKVRWLTQADAASRPDSGLPLTHIVGKVVGGDCHAHAVRVPVRHRLWAGGRFLRHALRAVRRRYAIGLR